MCVIAAVEANKIVEEETLRNCWVGNDDGAGFMYAKDGNLIVSKGFMTWEDFIKAWRLVPTNVPRVLHFRIKTHGETNEDNTHPFILNERMAFVHNGIINGVSNSNKGMNDTWHFGEEFLKPMLKTDGRFLNREWNIKLLGDYIGGSKLVFLNHEGEMWFVNKNKGIQEEGVWFSNTSYKPRVVHTPQKAPQRASKAPHWMCEGAYVRMKVTLPNKGLQRGDLLYVNNVLGNSLEVLIHDYSPGKIVERKLWVNQREVEEPDYSYNPDYTTGWY